uniref:transposase n=1 Tax=Archangium lipolyticum TaxID=2970465 RepID=UPI00389944D4
MAALRLRRCSPARSTCHGDEVQRGPKRSAGLELLRRVASLVPPPRAHLTRFHGIFAPGAQLRPVLVDPTRLARRQWPLLGLSDDGPSPAPSAPPTSTSTGPSGPPAGTMRRGPTVPHSRTSSSRRMVKPCRKSSSRACSLGAW